MCSLCEWLYKSAQFIGKICQTKDMVRVSKFLRKGAWNSERCGKECGGIIGKDEHPDPYTMRAFAQNIREITKYFNKTEYNSYFDKNKHFDIAVYLANICTSNNCVKMLWDRLL